MNKKIIYIVAGIVVIVLLVAFFVSKDKKTAATYRVGWISDLSGPQAKYGAYEAAKLAMNEVNQSGGINGKPLEIIFEDGKCNGQTAVSAMNKLINVDHVDIVLGGHCSPESVAIAPVAEQNKIIMLASITSTPRLSNAGKYVFRLTPVSTVQSPLMVDVAFNKLGLRNFAIVYELTDYAKPIAQSFKDSFEKDGGVVSVFEGYTPGTSDFRTILSKAKNAHVDGIFLAPQSPDAGMTLLQQIKDLGISARLFGNDAEANQATIAKYPNLFENLVAAIPAFDLVNDPVSKKFADAYFAAYNTKTIPYGVWTAEAYDSVNVIADALRKNGDNIEGIANYLSNLSNYVGASGSVSINQSHDGVRTYVLKIVKNGQLVDYK
jgi:branched-chain amino acid transport system substrate-binding protein